MCPSHSCLSYAAQALKWSVSTLQVLERIRGTTDVDAEFIDLCDAAEMSRSIQGRPILNIFKKQYRPQLVILCADPLLPAV